MSLVALHGGGASKVSSLYEEAWTLYSMLELLAGLATAIKLEPPGSAGHGFEFFLRRSDGEEWHQVKYQNSNGKWTLYELKKEDVLRRFKEKLISDPTASCRFVSSHSTHPLKKLCSHAAKSKDLGRFKGTYLSSKELTTAFKELADEHWSLTEETLWEWLHSRVTVSVMDDERLEQSLAERIALFVTGTPNDAAAALDGIREATLYEELNIADLSQQLTDKGCPPRKLSQSQGSVRDLVRETSHRLATILDSVLIHKSFIARGPLSEVKTLLQQTHPPETVLLTGLPGCGKSAVVGQIIKWALLADWEVLSLDVSKLSHEQDTEEIGKHLGLPSSPARALAVAAVGGRGLLIVDAMDSLSLNRGKPPELFTVVDRVIQEARAHLNITLVISCRSEDLDADERLRDIVHGEASLEVLEIPLLDEGQVAGSLIQAGFDLEDMNDEQLELVRLPELLKLLINSRDAGPLTFKTAEELRDRYIEFKTRWP